MISISSPRSSRHRRDLALGRPTTPTVALLFGSRSGRPSGSLSGSRNWFSLVAHGHLTREVNSFSSQLGVQENPRPRDHEEAAFITVRPRELEDGGARLARFAIEKGAGPCAGDIRYFGTKLCETKEIAAETSFSSCHKMIVVSAAQ